MADFDDTKLTEAVAQSFAAAADPRTRHLLQRLVSHLHAFVRDVELTFDEWRTAIDFLTRTGQMSNATRQEFILLSDVLGASMLVDAIQHRVRSPGGRGAATETTVLGPFYVGEHRVTPHGRDLADGDPATGDRLWVDASVSDTAGRPLAGAQVDVWHADAGGFYDSQKPGYALDTPSLRARFITGEDGRLSFRTLVPCSYPVPTDGPVGELLAAGNRHAMRPAHIHFLIAAPGFETLVTHVFVAGDKYLDGDAVFGVKPSLIARLEPRDEPAWPNGAPAPARWYRLAFAFALPAALR